MPNIEENTIEAALFLASKPIEESELRQMLPAHVSLENILQKLQFFYKERGVNLVKRGDAWCFITDPSLSDSLVVTSNVPRRLSRAAMETLAIIAYYQPITRVEIENIRGVAFARTTLDALMETGWIAASGHRPVPGRPTLWTTTTEFLHHFGLESLHDLPLREELSAQGIVSSIQQGELFSFSTDQEDTE